MARQIKTSVKMSGFKELEAALAQLPKATAKNTLNRALMKAAIPMRDAAVGFAPIKTGKLRDGIIISKKTKNGSIRGEIAGLIKQGHDRVAAVSKAKANRAARGMENNFAQIYLGVASNIRQAIPQEFGTEDTVAHPFMRPAFDGKKEETVNILRGETWTEINKSANRLAKKKAKAG